jgi:hypothetical protein
MQAKLEAWRETVNEWVRQHRAAATLATAAAAEHTAATNEATAARAALVAAQGVATGIQQQAHQRIAGLVGRCLRVVFDDPYEFTITFEQKRGRTDAVLKFTRAGAAVDPMAAAGGGVVDVAGFALRLAALMLALPPHRRLLVLDEPFKFVSAEYRPRVRAMLEALSHELGIQIIFVTHITELRTGTVCEV